MPVVPTIADGIELGGEYVGEREYTRIGAASVLVAAVGLVAAAGLRGVAAAAVLGIAWLLARPVDAFAVGQVAVVAFAWDRAFGASAGLVGNPLGAVAVGAAEVGLFGLLLAPAARLSNPRGPVALAVWWALAGGLLAWASAASWLDVWLAGVVLLGLAGAAAYGLHRYQVVTLGLTEGVGRRVGEREETDGRGGEASER